MFVKHNLQPGSQEQEVEGQVFKDQVIRIWPTEHQYQIYMYICLVTVQINTLRQALKLEDRLTDGWTNLKNTTPPSGREGA